jgi:hypothetical protein
MGLWDKNKKRRQYHKENGIVNDTHDTGKLKN